jgi:PhnB protein
MSNTATALIPYLHFGGNCEEALHFYAQVLGGTVEITQRYDNPAMNAPEDYKQKVLHGRLHFGDLHIYASDVFPGQGVAQSSGDAALSLAFTDPDMGKQVFGLLAEGGKVGVPFEKQFWGEWHGNLVDRYGIRWMVNS